MILMDNFDNSSHNDENHNKLLLQLYICFEKVCMSIDFAKISRFIVCRIESLWCFNPKFLPCQIMITNWKLDNLVKFISLTMWWMWDQKMSKSFPRLYNYRCLCTKMCSPTISTPVQSIWISICSHKNAIFKVINYVKKYSKILYSLAIRAWFECIQLNAHRWSFSDE